MLPQIVILLRIEMNEQEAKKALKALPAWADVKLVHTELPAPQTGEDQTISDMRRTISFDCPMGVDIEKLIKALSEDPLVKKVYYAREVKGAGSTKA